MSDITSKRSGIIRWRPLKTVNDPPAPVDSKLDHVDENGQRIYKVWPAGRPEPKGNVVKWSESTLRQCYEVDREGAGE